MPKETECIGCGTAVFFEPGGFKSAHKCPNQGQDAGRPCPDCGAPTVFRVGRHSTFRGCSKFPACAGRVGAPRGKAASGSAEAETESAIVERFARNESESKAESIPTPTPDVQKEQTMSTPTPAAVDAGGAALWALVGPHAEAKLAALAIDAAAKAAALVAGKSVTVEWKQGDTLKAKVQPGAHKAVAECVKLVARGFKNILLVGPMGSGKSTVARAVAEALSVSFGIQGFSEGVTESALLGREIPNLQTGDVTYRPARFVAMYTSPGVFCLDEIDRANANAVCVMNEALANGHMATPTGEQARHAEFIVIATANTYGQGGDRVYAGANQLDGAFLDRFAGAIVTVDYDRDLETALVSGLSQGAQILAKVWAIREKVLELKLRRGFGTRTLVAVARHVAGGDSIDSALKRCVEGWTSDERSRAGVK